MLFDSVRVQGFRSIEDSGDLALGPVTLLVGPNNAGKSALLRAIYLSQDGSQFSNADLRLRQTKPNATVTLEASDRELLGRFVDGTGAAVAGNEKLRIVVKCEPNGLGVAANIGGIGISNVHRARATRPDHLIVPVLSRRKSNAYGETVGSQPAAQVGPTDINLTSRIDSLTSNHPEGRRYESLLDRVLGVQVGTYLSANGKQPGVPLSSVEAISLDRMGEGVSSVLSIVSELADDREHLFLVEEPENDLHPRALARLLDVISEYVPKCQFIVSTHSDLVVRHLGSTADAVVYRVDLSNEDDDVPTSRYEPVTDSFERAAILSDLGYEPQAALGWLIFEESTAERIVNNVLIPLFTPRLAGLRTVAGRGVDSVAAMFNDLHRTVLFLHRDFDDHDAWVIVDGDASGREVIAKLQAAYGDWPKDRFRTWSEAKFESYYPARFADQVAAIDTARPGLERQTLKGKLAEDVDRWANANPQEARTELEASAGPVIAVLKEIEDTLRLK